MLDIAYVAGIIDGEGCIQFRLEKKSETNIHLYPGIVVNMTNQELVKLLHEQFGGSFCVRGSIKDNRKIQFSWQLQGFPVLSVITKIYPFLVVKKEQAKLVMQFFALDENDNTEINTYFKTQMSILNKRGV